MLSAASFGARSQLLRLAAMRALSSSSQVSLLRNEKDGVFTVKLDNEKKKNSLSFATFKELEDRIREAADDPKCRAVLWTGGSGSIFCSGLDLWDFTEQSCCLRQDVDPKTKLEKCNQLGAYLQSLVSAFIDFPKPLIAGVNGLSIGFGVTGLGLCDAVLAKEDKASFSAPFTSLAFTPEACSSIMFPKIMGPLVASDVLLFGRSLSAQEALQVGLVTRIVGKDKDFQAECERFAKMAASLPIESFRASKRLIRGLDREALHAANRAECTAIARQWASKEVATAIDNFMNRKKPKK